jgi:hypothetical protein
VVTLSPFCPARLGHRIRWAGAPMRSLQAPSPSPVHHARPQPTLTHPPSRGITQSGRNCRSGQAASGGSTGQTDEGSRKPDATLEPRRMGACKPRGRRSRRFTQCGGCGGPAAPVSSRRASAEEPRRDRRGARRSGTHRHVRERRRSPRPRAFCFVSKASSKRREAP